MAKDKRIVAGKIQDTTYYYASDGSVVDENGKPAPAKFAAIFPPMPAPEPEPVAPTEPTKEKKPRKTRRKLKEVAGKLGNSKYYYDKDGNVVDEEGKPVSDRLAKTFGKREAIAEAMPKIKSKANGEEGGIAGVGPHYKQMQLEIKEVFGTTDDITKKTNDIEGLLPKLFEQFSDVIKTLNDKNDEVIQKLVQQNEEFQEKVFEAITGVVEPTKSGGAKSTKKKKRGVGGSRAASKFNFRETRKTEVKKRAARIAGIRAKKNIAKVAGAGIVGTAAGVGAGALVATILGGTRVPTTPAPPSGAPGTPSKPPAGAAPGAPPPETKAPPGTRTAPTPITPAPQGPPTGTGGVGKIQAPGAITGPNAAAPPTKKEGGGAGPTIGAGGLEAAAREMIARHEGRRNRPYKDSRGLWTVGIGHLIGNGTSLPAEMNREFSDAEIDQMFSEDYKHHAEAAAKIPGYDKINDQGKLALIDLTFNMGPVWYKKWPNFTKAMAEGNYEQAAASLQQSAWYGQVGRRAPEIVALIKGGGKANETQMAGGPGSPMGAPSQGPPNAPGETPGAGGETGAGGKQTAGAGGGQMTGEKPKNVSFESGKVDVGGVNPELLKRFYSAASEYGKPVRINSAYRGDEYQAQLWVRGNILHEPGIHIPAKPEKAQTINYKGQTYNVPGSGKGSSHGKGQALDINPQVGSDFQGVLNKYGINYPFGAKDPPHIQMAAYAKGEDYVPDTGPAIVGEKGPELVIGQDGSSRLTGDGPHVEKLNKGDSILPADKTKQILPAYAKGTPGAAEKVNSSLSTDLILDSDWQPHIDQEKHSRYMGGRSDTMSDDERNEYEGFKNETQKKLFSQKVAHPEGGGLIEKGDLEDWQIQEKLRKGERVDPNNPPESMTKRELASRIQQYGMPGLASGAYSPEEFQRITRAAGQFQWQTDAEDKYRAAEEAKKKPQGVVKPLEQTLSAYAEGTDKAEETLEHYAKGTKKAPAVVASKLETPAPAVSRSDNFTPDPNAKTLAQTRQEKIDSLLSKKTVEDYQKKGAINPQGDYDLRAKYIKDTGQLPFDERSEEENNTPKGYAQKVSKDPEKFLSRPKFFKTMDDFNISEGVKSEAQKKLFSQKVEHPEGGGLVEKGDLEDFQTTEALRRGERPDKPESMSDREYAARVKEYGGKGLVSGAFSPEEFQKMSKEADQPGWVSKAQNKAQEWIGNEKEKGRPVVRPLENPTAVPEGAPIASPPPTPNASPLNMMSQENSVQDYFQQPVVQTIVMNNTITNTRTKTVSGDSGSISTERSKQSNPLIGRDSSGTPMGAF